MATIIPIKVAIMSLLSHIPKLKIICIYSISAKVITFRALISHINLGLLIASVLLKDIGTI